MIPLPKLLDANMQESRRIRAIDASVKESIVPLSYATVQLAENESIPAKSYMELFTPNGSAGVFRTKSRPDGYGDSRPVLELEHAVTEVGDFLVREDIEQEMSLSAAFARLFSHYRGNLWQLGAVPFTDPVIVDMGYEPVLQGMLLVLEQIPKYYLTFDFTTTPWTLSVAERDTVVSAEGRLGRNVKSAMVTPDDTEFCTRVYMKGLPLKPGQGSDELGYIDADTISVYGVKENRLDGSDSITQEQAIRKATAYLNKRKKPKLGISISGTDFSSVTGEPLDRIAIGKLYRLAVPKHKTTVEENITGIEWRSVYQKPNQVEIELSEEADPTVDFLQQQRAASRSGRRAAAKEMDYFYQELYSDDGLIHSVILQTSTMIRTEVGSAVSGIYGSVIEQTASYIRSVVYDTASSISQSVIEQTSEYIRTTVESTASGVAWSVVEQTMTNIVQRIGRKNKVYVQLTDPNDGINELIDGDIWIFSKKRTWGQMRDLKWDEVAQSKWRDYYGALQYVWRNGAWIKVLDEAAIVESETWIEQDSERYAILARQVDSVGEHYQSNLTVTAQKISTEVRAVEKGLQSNIEQTAERITLSVSAAQSRVYSVIEQTATSIRLAVEDLDSELQSSIQMTSTNIYLSVSAAKSTLYGAINVTSTGIMQEVVDRENSLRSAINITSTNIMQEVVDADNNLRSAINISSTKIAINSSQIELRATKTYVEGELEGLSAKFDSITVIEGSSRYLQSGKVYATSSLSIGGSGQGGSGSGTLYYRGTAYYPNFIILKDKSNANICEATFLGTKSANNSFDLTHYHEIKVEEGTGALAGKMVVTLGKPSSSEGSANFNIADTTTYKNGVSAARNQVKVKAFTANAVSSLTSSRTFTYATDAPSPVSGSEQVDSWYLDESGWSGGTNNVYLRYGSYSGTAYARVGVSMPSRSSMSFGSQSTSSSGSTYSYDKAVNINGNYEYTWLPIYLGGETYRIRIHPMI